MKILIIDTCGSQGSVALADGQNIFTANMPGRSASERLVGTVRELAQKSGIALRQLNAIAVVNGPGSFTGVRVGLSAAKGWCEALGLPLVTLSRLAVLASLVKINSRVIALIDAGRGQVYCGEYINGVFKDESLVSLPDLEKRMSESAERPAIVVYEETVAQALPAFAPQIVAEPDAEAALPLVLKIVALGKYADIASTDGNYLRRTDQEIFAKMSVAAEARRGRDG